MRIENHSRFNNRGLLQTITDRKGHSVSVMMRCTGKGYVPCATLASIVASNACESAPRARTFGIAKGFVASVALVSTALLSGCGGNKFATLLSPPTIAQITIRTEEKINVDSRGRSTPVVLRYYFLKNAAAFNSADFFSLYEKDLQTLGDAIVRHEEVLLTGGETHETAPKDAGEAQVVGVIAAFRDIEHGIWRGTVPLPANKTTVISVNVKDNKITVRGDGDLIQTPRTLPFSSQ